MIGLAWLVLAVPAEAQDAEAQDAGVPADVGPADAGAGASEDAAVPAPDAADPRHPEAARDLESEVPQAGAEIQARENGDAQPNDEADEERAIEPSQLEFVPFEQEIPGGEEDPSVESVEEELPPTPHLPEFRLRAGGGISLATAGLSGVMGRATQEFEWQPPQLGFLFVGIGIAEMFPQYPTIQAGLRAGGYAMFCENALVRCTGAITLQVGVIAGAISSNVGFDFSADADLRFLFWQSLELHLRGGFFSFEMNSFVNITAGAGLAF